MPPRRRPPLAPRPSRLRLPEPAEGEVARPLGLPEPGTGAPVVVVRAPAGWGKTTALAAWARALPHPVAWLRLEGADDDPAHLLASLQGALRSLRADLDYGESALAMGAPPTLALRALLADLERVDAPFALVLDDVHRLSAATAGAVLAPLAAELPPAAVLALSSRGDPPLPLARLRAAGRLVERGPEDLALDLDAVGRLLSRVLGRSVSAAEAGTVHRHTGGWAAAVRLAGIAVREGARRAAPPSLEEVVSGAHRFLYDYLAEEVLAGLEPALVRLLERGAVLEALTPSAGAALTGEDADALLERADRLGLFLPRSGADEGYRMHPLFAAVLRGRLGGTEGRDARLRAARWLDARGRPEEATEQRLAAEAWEEAAADLAPQIDRLLAHGRASTALRWLDALPAPARAVHPELDLWRAWIARGAPPALPPAGVPPGAAEGPDAGAALEALLRARACGAGGDPAQAEHALRAAAAAPPERPFLRFATASALQAAYRFTGEARCAEAGMRRFAELGREAEAPELALRARSMLANLQLLRGRYGEAERTLRAVLAASARRFGPDAPAAAMAHQFLGYVLFARRETEEARTHLRRAVALALPARSLGVLSGSYRVLAQVEMVLDDRAAAFDLQARLEALVEQDGDAGSRDYVRASRVALALRAGERGEALAWLRERRLTTPGPAGIDPRDLHLRTLEHDAVARSLLAVGRAEEAVPLLRALLGAMEGAGRDALAVGFAAQLAAALLAAGDEAGARDALARAVALAAPEGLAQPLVDAGPEVGALLRTLPPPPGGEGFVARVAAALDGERAPRLTGGELRVLREAAAGRSNKAIAAGLGLSLATVKTHLHHAYGKLSARNRTQALARARAAGLLDGDGAPRPNG